jgi:two-component system, NtrC family, sensor kinase
MQKIIDSDHKNIIDVIAKQNNESLNAYLEKWQKTVDLMAHLFEVPSGLIMKVHPTQLEVLVSSQTENNPYQVNEKADLNTGLYCETVIAQREELHVANALEDSNWNNNPDLDLKMISYLGVPLIWPNNEIFGTICVLDNKTRHYASLYHALLWQFKEIVDGDLKLLVSEHKQKQHANDLCIALERLKATQEELIQSEKMAALGHLVAGIAHEINTPLGAIRSSVGHIAHFIEQDLNQLPTFFHSLSESQQENFLALLQQSASENTSLSTREKRKLKKALIQYLEEQAVDNASNIAETLSKIGIYDNVDGLFPLLKDPDCPTLLEMAYQLAIVQKSTRSIATASDRAAKTIFALKNFARFDSSGQKVHAQLTESIETVLTLYQNQLKQGVEVIKSYGKVAPLLCYPDELNQVWTNLIHNALHAMGNKGTLTIELKEQAHQLLVCITDSGIGIPENIQPKIFDPFFTTKPPGEGSGLGLDIVKKIIKKHEGTITVDSQPGQTTFTVSLPIT